MRVLCDSAISCRYKNVLSVAATQIGKLYGTSHDALVLNLGPAWLSPEAYGLFNNNVIEIPFKDWESPPGLGICPLGVIFTVCSSIASWLALNEDNVVVSHTLHAHCSKRKTASPMQGMDLHHTGPRTHLHRCQAVMGTSPMSFKGPELIALRGADG